MGMITGDRVLETTTTTGTGNITLNGAVTGYRAFSAVATANGDMFPYVIAGASEWEVGIGTRQSSTIFSRSVTASSNANALVSFSAGTKEVWIDWTNSFISSMQTNNLIINGGMKVAQEFGTSAQTGITATFKYPIDNWFLAAAGAVVVTTQQVTDAPAGFSNSLKISVTTADASLAATDRLTLAHYIEGYRIAGLGFGAAGSSSVALGFYVKAHRTGTYSGAVTANSGRSYPFNFTVNSADTWEYNTIAIPGDTAGTWLTDFNIGMKIFFTIAAGSNFLGTAGAWAATDQSGVTGTINGVAATTDTFQITGVSLIPGSAPVSQDMVAAFMRPFDEELIFCQRYYEKSYDYGTALGAITNNGITVFFVGPSLTSAAWNPAWYVPWKVRKRTAPTVTIYSNATGASGKVRDAQNGADVNPTTLIGETGMYLQATVSAASTAFNMQAHFVVDARM